ncbi:MAG: HD-GYP domain-containing protein [Pirellulaceae bacterium]|nr:HD-GYP domain-containing protein [Pirellulaceae bacterium]
MWTHDVAWRLLDDGANDDCRQFGDDLHEVHAPQHPPVDLLTSHDPRGDKPRTIPAETTADVWLAIPLSPPYSAQSFNTLDAAMTPETLEAVRQSRQDRQKRIVAVGKISGANEQIVRNLAELFLRDVERQTNNDRLANENRALLRQITNDSEELFFLRTIAELLDVSDRSFDLKAMAEAMLPTLRPLCEATCAVLLEANPSDPQLPPRPMAWCGPRTIDDMTCSHLVQAFREACAVQPVVINDFHETANVGQYPGVEGLVLVPIVNTDETVGWLLALNRMDERGDDRSHDWNLSFLEFGTHEASLMSYAATILATHSRNTDLLRERERMVVSVVRALVTAIEAKDEYTRGHSERVALYGKRLAEELGFDAEYCERLYLTGLLHDVGKIGVSDAVLCKPGALSPEEFDEIKQHPDKGWAILADIEPLTYVLPGVLHHHEQFHGGGYPDELSGTDIHVDGRILAVADAYDAMTSDRPYRQGMPHNRAEEILRDGSGQQWDAEIIDVFFRVVPDILKIKKDYRPRTQTCRKKTKPASASEMGAHPAPPYSSTSWSAPLCGAFVGSFCPKGRR